MTKNEAIYFEERKKFEAAKEKESAASYHNYNLQQEVSVLRLGKKSNDINNMVLKKKLDVN